MSMNLTDENRLEIREIAREINKESAASVKQNSEKLTERIDNLSKTVVDSIERMAGIITGQVKTDLRAVETNFESRITLIIEERRNDIKQVSSDLKLCKSECEKDFLKMGSAMTTKDEVYKILARAGGLVTLVISILSLISYIIIRA